MQDLVGRKADGWLPSLPVMESGGLPKGNAIIDDAARAAGTNGICQRSVPPHATAVYRETDDLLDTMDRTSSGSPPSSTADRERQRRRSVDIARDRLAAHREQRPSFTRSTTDVALTSRGT
jgi:hypothetical protein